MLKNRALILLGKALWRSFDRLTENPRQAQEDFLLRLIRRNRATAFGRDHVFDKIRSVDDYFHQVPLADYERHRPYVEMIKNGNLSALTSAAPFMFTVTSGTTGEPKLIPVTKASLRINARRTKIWYYRALLDHPRFLRGKLLGVVSPAVEGHTPGGLPYGSASGQTYQTSPWWVKRAYAVPYEVSEIENYDAKYYVVMRLAIEQDVSFLATPNPSTIMKLTETADVFKDAIVRDIRDGSISNRFEVSPEIRDKLSARVAPNAARAHELERLIHARGALRPHDYWPGLQLIGCWKGGTVGGQLKKFDRWFRPETPVRDLGYLASEAHISLPIADAASEGILAVDANFYEFVPENEMSAANPRTLMCHELQEGAAYYIILTTSAGLYRYDINDVVKVTGFYRKTPVIEFLRKGRDVTSLTGEKVHVNQIVKALEEAQRLSGIEVRHYRAVADDERTGYGFMVEIEGSFPNEAALALFLDQLDNQLSILNVEYAQKRNSKRLSRPYLCVMQPGWFNRKYRSNIQAAVRDSQFKASLLGYQREDEAEILFKLER